jgi:hypothetical protein
MPRAGRALLLCSFLCVCLCASGFGCRREASQAARIAERIEPHLPVFARFDRWVRRALVAPGSPREREVLAEVVFAPIRNATDVLAAWVERDGERTFVLSLPALTALPSQVSWIALRDPELGALRVAAKRPCALVLPKGWRPELPSDCVLIARSDRAVTVTLALRDAGATDSAGGTRPSSAIP